MEDQIILERLRKAFQSIHGTQAAHICPDPEKIWDAQKGVLNREETHAMIAHTSACGACAEAWRVALEISDPPAMVNKPARGTKVFRLPWLVPIAALAAAAVLILAFAIQSQRSPSIIPSEISFRDSTHANEIRSMILNTSKLPRNGFDLKWEHAFGAGTTFDIQVQTEDLQSIVQANGLTGASYVIPSAALKDLPSGTRLLWQIIIRMDGEQIKWSPTFINVVE